MSDHYALLVMGYIVIAEIASFIGLYTYNPIFTVGKDLVVFFVEAVAGKLRWIIQVMVIHIILITDINLNLLDACLGEISRLDSMRFGQNHVGGHSR
jgi:hypothetical protein